MTTIKEKPKKGAKKQERIKIPQMVGKEELAEFMKVSPRQIERWEEDGLDRDRTGPRNMYDLYEVFQFRFSTIREKSMTELDLEKLRETKAKADLRELEVEEKRLILLPTDLVLRAWQSILTSVRTAFRGLPSDFKIFNPKLRTEDIDFLKKRITEILKELADSEPIPASLKKYAVECETDFNAPAGDDPKSMD